MPRIVRFSCPRSSTCREYRCPPICSPMRQFSSTSSLSERFIESLSRGGVGNVARDREGPMMVSLARFEWTHSWSIFKRLRSLFPFKKKPISW
jgi:hypothetical protein